MPTNTAPLPALYCHPNDPVAGTVLLPTHNNRADMHTIHQSTDSTNTPAITTQLNNCAVMPAIHLTLAPVIILDWGNVGAPYKSRGCIGAKFSDFRSRVEWIWSN